MRTLNADATRPERQRSATRTTVLLAEDEVPTAILLARALRAAGYDVYEAATIAEALDLLVELGDGIDIAVLDYFLPAGEPLTVAGREFVQRYIALKTAEVVTDAMYTWRIAAAILFMSGHDDNRMRHIVCQTRAFGSVQKPFSPDELLRALDSARRWHANRTHIDPTPQHHHRCIDLPPAPGGYCLGLYRVTMHLAGIGPQDTDLHKVLWTSLFGVYDPEDKRSHWAHAPAGLRRRCKHTVKPKTYEACGMSRSTYDGLKRELKDRLGIDSLAHELPACIDEALLSGEVQWWQLVGYECDPYNVGKPARVSAGSPAVNDPARRIHRKK